MAAQSYRLHLSELSFALEIKKELRNRMTQSENISEKEELDKLIKEIQETALAIRKLTN
jgi:hypothetical protein